MTTSIEAGAVGTLYVACEAGMGSSAMLASTIRKQLKGTEVVVKHVPVTQLPEDATLVLCQQSLAHVARSRAGGAVIVPFRLFIGDPAVTRVVNALKSGGVVHA